MHPAIISKTTKMRILLADFGDPCSADKQTEGKMCSAVSGCVQSAASSPSESFEVGEAAAKRACLVPLH